MSSQSPLNFKSVSLLILGTLTILSLTQLWDLERLSEELTLKGQSSSSIHLNFSMWPILQSNVSILDDESPLNFELNKLPPPPPTPPPTYRLPKDLLPWRYELKIRPIVPPPSRTNGNSSQQSSNEKKATYFTVPGRVAIWFHCVQATDRIRVNVQKLLVRVHEDSVKVFKAPKIANQSTSLDDDLTMMESQNFYNYDDLAEDDLDQIPVIGHEYDSGQEFYTILLGRMIHPEDEELFSYGVVINFTSIAIQYRSMGIFANSYYDDPSKQSMNWIVATQFQPTFARRAFPCFDEPGFKAIFEITIGRREGYHSLSNAMLKKTLPDPDNEDWYWDRFEPTLKMSVYLVCFAVSNFVSEDRVAANGKPIKVWAPQHLIERGAGSLAANLTSQFVTYFENLFNMTDPIPKVDSIMIPHYTSTGMENYGLITYAEHYLMYLPNRHPQIRRRLITTVVAHELSHFYFGNIVTCDWWSDIWLNEGFATFLSFMAMEELHPDLEAQDQFVSDTIQGSMRFDPDLTTNPVKMSRVMTRADVENSFSRSAYRKGGSLVHMLKFILGEPILIEGMKRFLKKFAFKSANQDDLFKEFDAVGHHRLPPNYDHVTVQSIMTPWTLQSSYPLVRVSLLDSGQLKFSQEPVSRSRVTPNDRGSSSWWIPLWIMTDQSQNQSEVPVSTNHRSTNWSLPDLWIPHNASTIFYQISQINQTNQWIIINPHYEAYIAILYDQPLSIRIKKQLEKDHTVFSTASRTQILFDYLHFWESGYVPIESLLNMTVYLGQEKDFIVWNTLFPFFWDLNRKLVANEKLHRLFRKYVASRTDSILDGPELRKVQGSLNDKDTSSLFKGELMTLACHVDSPACRNYTVEIIEKFELASSTNSTSVDLSMKHITMSIWACAFVRAGGETAWEFMNDEFDDLVNHFGERWSLFYALTCATSEQLIERSLQVVTNSSLDLDELVNVAPHAMALDFVFDFLMDKYELDFNSFHTTAILTSTLSALSPYLYKMEHSERLQKFIEVNKNKLDQGEIWILQNYVDTIKDNGVWMNVQGLALSNWLTQNMMIVDNEDDEEFN